MQIPYRKPGKYCQIKNDPLLTADKVSELEKKLVKLKKLKPHAMVEVARLAELGDFSENVEYQLAKGRLRGISNNILKLTDQIDHAIVINPQKQNQTVQIGHTVTVEVIGNPSATLRRDSEQDAQDKEKKYLILGSAETNPSKNIISHNSPIGLGLLGHRVGEEVKITLANKILVCKIVRIE